VVGATEAETAGVGVLLGAMAVTVGVVTVVGGDRR